MTSVGACWAQWGYIRGLSSVQQHVRLRSTALYVPVSRYHPASELNFAVTAQCVLPASFWTIKQPQGSDAVDAMTCKPIGVGHTMISKAELLLLEVLVT
jgi:hypothetical protein